MACLLHSWGIRGKGVIPFPAILILFDSKKVLREKSAKENYFLIFGFAMENTKQN